MRAIFKEFIEGDSVKKLAIIADILAILGVSIATLVAGPFLSKFSGIDFVLSDFIVAILFYFLCVWFSSWALYGLARQIVTSSANREYRWVAGQISFGMLAVWTGIICFPYAKSFAGNAFNSSYLLAPAARNVINNSGPLNATVIFDKDHIASKGKVSFKEDANVSDYVAAVYFAKDNGQFGLAAEISEFNSAGEYLIPRTYIYSSRKVGEAAYIVVYRKSDWRLSEVFSGGNKGYPITLNVIPNVDLEQMHAWYKKLEVIEETRL